MVFRMEYTYYEVAEILDTKHIDAKSIAYSFAPGIYEDFDINLMLNSFFPDEAKVKITIDDIRLGSSLTNNKSFSFTEKSFFYTIMGFTQSHLGPLGDIEGFL